MRNHGYDPDVDKHTCIQGIWEKLETLYDLQAIDEREDFDLLEDDKFLDFELPPDYATEQFERGRIRSSSPPSDVPTSPAQYNPSPSPPRKRKRRDTSAIKRGSTVDDTDEPRTSPPNSPSAKPRRGRGTTRTSGRAKAESSSRAPSKETAQDEEEVDDTDEGEEDEDDGDDGSVTASEKQSRNKSRGGNTIVRKSRRKR